MPVPRLGSLSLVATFSAFRRQPTPTQATNANTPTRNLIIFALSQCIWPTIRCIGLTRADLGLGLRGNLRMTATAVLLLRSRGSLPASWKLVNPTPTNSWWKRRSSNRWSENPDAQGHDDDDDEARSPLLGDIPYSGEASPASSLDITDHASTRDIHGHRNLNPSEDDQLGRRSPRAGGIRSIGSARESLRGNESYVELIVKILGTIAVFSSSSN